MWILFAIISGLVLIVMMIIIIRTILFKPLKTESIEPLTILINEERVIESLVKMIQFKTISHIDKSLVDESAFKGFIDYLKNRYPLINQQSTISWIEPTGIIFKLSGKTSSEPTVLMAHYDVVPENGTWDHNPFSGTIIEGSIYGRGTLDTKTTLCSVMEAVEHCLLQNINFENDLYLAFAGDEEVYGISAQNMVQHFKSLGVKPKLVLDEGGAVVSNMFPGVKKKTAVIGIAEKGVLSLELSAKSQGGHAAMPAQNTPVTQVAKAVTKLNKTSTFKLKLTPSVRIMFDTVARHSQSFAIKMIFANLWLFLPLVKIMANKTGGEMLSLFKTTQAFTMMQGSEAINVLPSQAKIGINYRLITGENTDEVMNHVQKVINNPAITIKSLYANNPTNVSLIDESYQKISQAINETWSDICPTPYLMMAATDSRFYHEISTHVYRFSPLYMSKEDLKSIHGVNEKVSIDNVMHCVRFYINLLQKI